MGGVFGACGPRVAGRAAGRSWGRWSSVFLFPARTGENVSELTGTLPSGGGKRGAVVSVQNGKNDVCVFAARSRGSKSVSGAVLIGDRLGRRCAPPFQAPQRSARPRRLRPPLPSLGRRCWAARCPPFARPLAEAGNTRYTSCGLLGFCGAHRNIPEEP